VIQQKINARYKYTCICIALTIKNFISLPMFSCNRNLYIHF